VLTLSTISQKKKEAKKKTITTTTARRDNDGLNLKVLCGFACLCRSGYAQAGAQKLPGKT